MGKSFCPSSGISFCGSKKKKTGCAYAREQERLHSRAKIPAFKEYQREYQKEWRQEQRQNNTDYAKRQRLLKREYSKTPHGRLSVSTWRLSHPEVIRQANRRRKLMRKKVFGSHTQKEWENLKKSYDFKCARCGVSERDLEPVYPNQPFSKLIRDHILPISKGGTDFISNIQPLCVSCNPRKRDAFLPLSPGSIVSLEHFEAHRPRLGKIVCTSCPADPIHPGHLSCLLESTAYGDSLVVIVNGDWFLRQKKGVVFMSLDLRSQIIAGIRGVDAVVPFEIENDMTVCEALKAIRPHVFTKGGDRVDKKTIPEWPICEEYGIEIITGVGDSKVHSSSNILEDWYNRRLQLFSDRG